MYCEFLGWTWLADKLSLEASSKNINSILNGDNILCLWHVVASKADAVIKYYFDLKRYFTSYNIK